MSREEQGSVEQEIVNEETIKLKTWRESMETLLGSVDSGYLHPLSISIVPDQLRSGNENAYIPKAVSIGPRFKGTRDLLPMEEIKWSCMLFLLHRTENPTESLKLCSEAVLKLDTVVRTYYVDDVGLDRYDLATIMLYDGCFLLELLIGGSGDLNDKLQRRSSSDSSGPGPGAGAEVRKMEVVLSDLTLLENQIPFIILHTLLGILFPQPFAPSERVNIINNLALSLFGDSRDSSFNSTKNFAHLLELVYSSSHEESHQKLQEIQRSPHLSIEIQESQQSYVELNRCATRLQAAGVTIKTPGPGDSKPVRRLFSSIRRAGRKHVNDPAVSSFNLNFDIKFSNGKLEIPPLHITETTEAKWRNFIAWEHLKNMGKSTSSPIAGRDRGTTGFSSICTASALLFNGLICCVDDVQLLKDSEVIVDHLSMSNRDLVAFFRSIVKGVDHGIIDSCYSKMFQDLDTYSATRNAERIPIILWHYGRRTTESIYILDKFLKSGYNFAATALTVLTFVQTIYAILSYHKPKK